MLAAPIRGIHDASVLPANFPSCPSVIHCNVTGTYTMKDRFANSYTVYMYKGLPYPGTGCYGITATAGDITVIFD